MRSKLIRRASADSEFTHSETTQISIGQGRASHHDGMTELALAADARVNFLYGGIRCRQDTRAHIQRIGNLGQYPRVHGPATLESRDVSVHQAYRPGQLTHRQPPLLPP